MRYAVPILICIVALFGMSSAQENSNSTEERFWRSLADQGNWMAQVELGAIYYTKKDFVAALQWYLRAAKQGAPRAQTMVGVIYRDGQGLKSDTEVAAKWFQLAADNDEITAQKSLAEMYIVGDGVPVNHTKAFALYKAAAEQGDASAQATLGAMLSRGSGAPKDYEMAYAWFNLSASAGNRIAASLRDKTEERLSPTQIEHAQDFTRRWVARPSKTVLPSLKSNP